MNHSVKIKIKKFAFISALQRPSKGRSKAIRMGKRKDFLPILRN
jgi:hypothetical protein